MLSHLLTRFVPGPLLYAAPLGIALAELSQRLSLPEPTVEESSWLDAIDYRFTLPDYILIAQVSDGLVKGYIHNTERYRRWNFLRAKKLASLLSLYGEQSPFRFIIDNGFGHLYRSEDGRIRAAYSHLDIFSVSLFELKRRSEP